MKKKFLIPIVYLYYSSASYRKMTSAKATIVVRRTERWHPRKPL